MIQFILNCDDIALEGRDGLPLLDFVRQDWGLKGCKEACGEGDCGACQVLLGVPGPDGVDYRPANACLLPLAELHGKHVVTVEGLNGAELTPVQQALVEQGAIQCGFCTPGLVIALTAWLLSGGHGDWEQAQTYLGGNLCRCTGYAGIRRAVGQLGERLALPAEADAGARLARLIEQGVLPAYFSSVQARLAQIPAHCAAHGARAVPIGGGTDLYVRHAAELQHAELDVLGERAELHGIEAVGGHCVIGAATTLEDVRTSPLLVRYFAELPHDFDLVCAEGIRQLATVGGNLANASPIADMAVFLLALDAAVVLSDGAQRRLLPLRQFYLGYKRLNKTAAEYIEAVQFALPDEHSRFSFEKVGKRRYLDVASVNCAVEVRWDGEILREAHVAAGGVGPVPRYLDGASAYLRGKTLCAEHVKAAAQVAMAEVSPIDDVRGSARYKRRLLGQLLLAHFLKMFPERLSEEALL